MRKTDKIILTPQQERWLVRHFKHTKNDEIQSRLGISQKTLHRFARKLGLTKSKQFMKKCQDAAITAANKANRQNGWPPKGYVIPRSEEFRFKEGVSNVKRLGAKREAERIAKSAESRRKTMKMERIRINFGLPQKTYLKLCSNPKRIQCRYYLKKRGYLIERGSNEAIVTADTIRGKGAEEWARREGIRIIEQEI